METIAVILILLLAVVISGALARMSPLPIPLPLVQIGLGAVIAAFIHRGVALRPEIFFLLFLPPLLFLDGWRIPKEGLFRDIGTVLELAFGLVVFTVLGVGCFIGWLIPSMPLPVAFALAAVLSPTDPVAVSAIAERVPVPGRLMRILEGEALLNDTSGLVCMRFAVAAAMTGTFSLTAAAGAFLQLAGGGIVIGIAITWGTTILKNWISRRFGEDTGSQILISLLIPFGAYLLADQLHCSGILAAVAAGIAMSYAEQTGQASAITRIRRNAVWELMEFTANGIIFVLLGEQMPLIVHSAAQVVHDVGHRQPAWLLVYIAAILLALAVLRFIWIWLLLHFNHICAVHKGERRPLPGWRLIAATSLAGVRGAITLAGVLTLPLALNDGTPFPERDLAIFLAAGVIIASLIGATVGLPFLLSGLELPPEPSHQREEDRARIAAAGAAIRAIERALHDLGEGRSDADLYTNAGARIMALYRQRIEGRSRTGDDAALNRKAEEIERTLRLAGLRAERDEFYRLRHAHGLTDELVRKLVREVDLLETRYASP